MTNSISTAKSGMDLYYKRFYKLMGATGAQAVQKELGSIQS